jgi:hypothetical protein
MIYWVPFIILMGAALYRWRGMAHPKKHWFPRPFNQIAFALPFALLVVAHYGWNDVAFGVGFIALVLTTLGVLTGHGGGHDLGTYEGEREDERLEFIIKPLKSKMPEYWYDMLLLSITGMAITLPAGLLTLNPALALSGLAKGPAYAVARFGGTGTDGGELLTGAVLWGALWAMI